MIVARLIMVIIIIIVTRARAITVLVTVWEILLTVPQNSNERNHSRIKNAKFSGDFIRGQRHEFGTPGCSGVPSCVAVWA